MTREIQFLEYEIDILKKCLFQSISNNHKCVEESLQESLDSLTCINYSSYQERIDKLKNTVEYLKYSIVCIENIAELLEKLGDK